MLRKPAFWIASALISLACLLVTLRTFSHAFPLVTLDLRLDRESAMAESRRLAGEHGWGPAGYRQAASFHLDGRAQYFVELEAGGVEAFREMLAGDLYSPYVWQVRHFAQQQVNETLVRFTPAGEPYGFVETLSEEAPGASLEPAAARRLAEQAATHEWGIDLAAYELVEQGQETRPGDRTDHTLVYQRKNARIGDGEYRLRLVVGGDRLTELTHFVEIPEAFGRRYEQMRSRNMGLKVAADVAVIVLYGIGGCLLGLFFLLRQRWVLWRQAVFWGFLVSFLQLLVFFNQWPLVWMEYDTALTTSSFFLHQVATAVVAFLGLGVALAVSFIAAESLTRRAFPGHLRLWRLGTPDVAGSPAVLGRVTVGYLLVSVWIAYVVGMYLLGSRVLGWWTPSGALFEPDILATYLPWLTPIAVSFQAGFWEECLFRAVPLAGAALLGQRYGHRKAWIVTALILQAVVFGAAHADYPAQPFFARLVELIIPSIGLGLIYLGFGLLPAIVTHFAFDVVAFSMPLFVSRAPGAALNWAMVILLALVPLWVVLYARARRGRFAEVPEEGYNRSWKPAPPTGPPPVPEAAPTVARIPVAARRLVLAGGLLGILVWVGLTPFESPAPPLTRDRQDALKAAQTALAAHGYDANKPWTPLATAHAQATTQHRFVWQERGEEAYQQLLGTYLIPPHWDVRYAQFEGDVAARAEEYLVSLTDSEQRNESSRPGLGSAWQIRHELPEAAPGENLPVDAARSIAHQTLRQAFGLEPASLEEISATPEKQPERTDWSFTFADRAVGRAFGEGRADVVVAIAGDEVVDAYRRVHVPEAWERHEENRHTALTAARIPAWIVIAGLFGAGAVLGIVQWTRRDFALGLALRVFLLLVVAGGVSLLNRLPLVTAQFSTAQPFDIQMAIALVSGLLVLVLLLPSAIGLAAGWVQRGWQVSGAMSWRQSVVLGCALGALAAGAIALSARLVPSLAPPMGEVDAASSYLPPLSTATGALAATVQGGALLLVAFLLIDRLTAGWSRRRVLGAVLLVLLGPALLVATHPGSLALWLLGGLAVGLVALLAYVAVVRFAPPAVPIAAAVLVILDQLQHALLDPYPGAALGAVAGILLTTAVAVWWSHQLAHGRWSPSPSDGVPA